MSRYFLFLIGVIGLASQSYSQSATTSPYSVYGIGVLNDKSAAMNRAIGGVGIAIRDPNNLNNFNPAAYTSVQGATQIFELGLFTESNYYQTRNASDKFTTGNLSGINSWFRMSKKWASVVGLSSFSKVDYNIASSRTIGVEEGSSVTYSGTGGISQLYFGNAFQINRNLSIGVDGAYIFGSIQKDETITSGRGSGTVLKNKVSANRLKADFGAQYSFFMEKGRSLNVGLTYNPRLRLNTSGSRMLIRTNEGDTTSSENLNTDDYVLPRSVGAGVSYQTKRSILAVDFVFKEWSDAVLDNTVELKNTSRFALGYTYDGNPNGEKYWDFIQLKTGFHLQNSYLVLDNTSFNEWGVSAGIGLPVSGNRGSINLSYHYSQSGTLQHDLIRQQSSVIVLDFTFRDLWGIRRKFD